MVAGADSQLTVASDCLFEHIPLELERALKSELTIDNPKYVAARGCSKFCVSKLKADIFS